MLRPLLLLSALIGLAGSQVAGAWETFSDSSELDISSVPITFYGQKYEKLYVNINRDTFTVCFDGFFHPEISQDCIVGPPLDEDTVQFQTLSPDLNLNHVVRDYLPTLKSDLKGSVEFLLSYDGSKIQLLLADYGTQAALVFRDVQFLMNNKEFNVVVNSKTVTTLNIIGNPIYKDISGCRHSGVLYKPGVTSSDPRTCSSLACSLTAVFTSTGCGPMERCDGNGSCILDPICTVTGPTVIDFLGQVNSVDDRCAYSLMSSSSVPDLLVLANFQERRRKDVSFLDSVTLRLSKTGVDIQLEQGGRVRVDNSVLTLNSSAQLVNGVELSKDQTGVTAKLLISDYNTAVFFDGNTAQIFFTGPAGKDPSLQGLCGSSSSSLSEARLPQYSASNCTMQYTDTADSTINCNTTTERNSCNLLKEAPFTTCHRHTDPKPYITACTETLCNYPAVDGLNCQFLEAYARACSLRSNDELADWRSKAGCSPPQVFCQDRICSAHEFCAEKTVGGEHSCLCRAIFASPYRLTGTFGEPTVCDKNSGSVTLVGCLLEEKGVDYSSLHLNNQTCTGQMNEQTHMLTFNFNSSNTCGTVATAENNQLIYKNTITTQNSSSDIVRHKQFYIDFSCFYTQPDIKTMAFKIRDSSVIQQIVSGAWNYTLSIKAYTDAGLTQAVELSTEVQLDQKIWVEMKTDGLDAGLVAVVTDSCWATNQASPNGSLRYDLITNGCANPTDRTVTVVGNGLGTSNYFSFNMFSFPRSSGDIYLHCKLNLCGRQNKSCAPSCNRAHRRRRSARVKYENEAPAFITMAWTN